MSESRKMVYKPVHDEQFEKDVQKMKMSGRKSIIKKFIKVYLMLLDQSIEGQIRLKSLRDHALFSPYQGFRELHVQHDWLIVYKADHLLKEIYFARTGSHGDLFK